ncbi:Rha family transcriptional regulator [Campylobacter curvus]|uniref:Rha family transcriptional regulator n=1 Tax=Campylobacter curvus TaxID=200 RepID=UPI0014705A94|nr:Rha family transcriptional regulator [Campylobacter curvus]
MAELITINNQQISLETKGERVFTTSLDIARVFEKEHRNVLRDIDNLPNDDFRQLNFERTEQIAKFGAVERKSPYYNITRDGFAMLVMGFTGSKAYQWKTEYIKAFNLMEARLRGEMAKSVSVMDYLQSQLDILRQQEARLITTPSQPQDN